MTWLLIFLACMGVAHTVLLLVILRNVLLVVNYILQGVTAMLEQRRREDEKPEQPEVEVQVSPARPRRGRKRGDQRMEDRRLVEELAELDEFSA